MQDVNSGSTAYLDGSQAFKLMELNGELEFSLAVPTSTVIGYRPEAPHMICVLEHAQKHNGRLTLPGGKRTGADTHLQCAINEFDQEVGGSGASLFDIELLWVKADPLADVRRVSLAKATDNRCPQSMKNTGVTAFYGYPDYIYRAAVSGEPSPKDGEAKSVRWFDINDLVIEASPEASIFGAQHDLIIYQYRKYLQGGLVSSVVFADLAIMRSEILASRA
ncbi:MAG TPA: NUDIX domain-containing protein [Candidatus Obscuribacter sp.]|nr:NUDIX domain-containing protein [Candidatus Obscuribacter sp.]HNA72206.1 NUDIX domain-containing protein [Candidatus Obscuribacter sp.]